MKCQINILGGQVGDAAYYRIGPSCYLFVVTVYGRTWYFLIDCGIEPSQTQRRGWMSIDLQLLASILSGAKIDAVFITHAHLDHCGFLPAIEPYMREKAKVICTKTTAALLSHVFGDTLDQSLRKVGVLGDLPFDLLPACKFLWERVEIVPEPGVIHFAQGIDIGVWPAGHIHGACSFFFMITERGVNRRFAFMGDYSIHDQIIIPGAELPPKEWLLTGPEDVIVSCDCTNGGDDLPPWKDVLDEMADVSTRIVEQDGKWIGLTFSIVRWQLLIHELSKRIDRERKKTVIYGDGPSAQYVARILEENPWGEVRKFDLSAASMVGKNGGPTRKDLLGSFNGGRIITPSGMGHGPATEYLARFLEDSRSFFAMTGFVAEGTNAKKVLNAKKGETITLDGSEDEEGNRIAVQVKAECKQYRLTGHQHRRDAVGRICELFGVTPHAITAWRKDGRERNLREFLSDHDLALLSRKHCGLTHANTRAFDWFETYFSGWIATSRADRTEHRIREL